MGNLETPPSVRKLQTALHAKAKTRPASAVCLRRVFDFLGYTFGLCHSRKTGKAYLGTTPSKKSIKRICDAIRVATGQHTTTLSVDKLVKRLNSKLTGWANYFHLGPVAKAYHVVDAQTNYRLRKWLCRKHRVQGQGFNRYPDQYLYEDLKLVRLPGLTRNLPWAKA